MTAWKVSAVFEHYEGERDRTVGDAEESGGQEQQSALAARHGCGAQAFADQQAFPADRGEQHLVQNAAGRGW
ncbi:hypothetical protein SMD20_48145 [Nonomuraea sp. LP-02]|uniref:hypothetical protein n=1 Tax=Nonomuraea sp. LP-02 TaxID=3097960 RepID=UPI002E30180F|nr:hypothetical protein [Nonomuraea sp. LP-02]MED7932063.1 hypothetical protein [Nonomuraea sp. LP-02]